MHRSTRFWVIVGATLALNMTLAAGSVAIPAPPRAGAFVGSDFRISGPRALEDDQHAAVAYDAARGMFQVVWEDERTFWMALEDIYGKRVQAGGRNFGTDFRITGFGGGMAEVAPALAFDSTHDRFLVVWDDDRKNATRGSDIYGRWVEDASLGTTKAFRVSGGQATEDDVRPAVAYDPDEDRFLVVWEDWRDKDTRGADVYGRWVGPGGPQGADFRISGPAALGSDQWPDVAYDPDAHRFLVVWHDGRAAPWSGVVDDIYGRWVDASGPVGPDFQISGPAATTAERPALAYGAAADEFLVVWQDERNAASRGKDIYGRRVDAAGPIGNDFRICGAAAKAFDADPAVAYGEAGDRFLVVWEDERNFGTRLADVYGRFVAGGGGPDGPDFRVSGRKATRTDGWPAVAYSPLVDEFLVVWQDYRWEVTWGRGWDIAGRRVAG